MITLRLPGQGLRRGWPRLAAATTLLAGLASAAALDFIHHGDFRRMMHSGRTAGVVDLAALPQGPGQWGLGATAGLQGEIVQFDGRLLVTPGSDAQGRTRAPEPGEQAVLFAGARATAWRETPIPRDLDAPAFEAFLVDQARAAGMATDRPFVFRVEGRFPHLLWHVVTGEPAAADAGRAGHGGHQQQGPEGGAGGHGGHANARSAMRLFRQPDTSGQLLGVYSGRALEGVVSHPGERLHIHFADADAKTSGHVDRFSIAAGAVLRLPAP